VTFQTASQMLLAFGIILSAFGGFGSYFFGKLNQAKTQNKSDEIQRDLKAQIVKLQATFDAKTDLIFQALKVKEDVWIAVNTNTVPPGVAEYLLLIFKSDKGRISGKVRVQGSDNIASFSTSVNDTLPVAVANLWVPKEHQYKIPTVIEFTVTEKTAADSSLSIFTQGWIDSLGREPR
jgi:hypothetical protein